MIDHRGSSEGDPPPNGEPNEWKKLEPLLDAVLDAPPDQRDAVARELSGGVEAVYDSLRDLAAECERHRPFLDRPADERFASLLRGDLFAVPDLLAERYRIVRELGRGGMARVYLAHDLKHARDVAVKVLRPELGAFVGRARFLKEIEIVARLQHPLIVPLHDSGESDGLLYYVMPYEHGLSLRERLKRDGPLSVVEAVAVLRDICEALIHAHAHGIVHRDIKPDNVLFSANHALVADFGIARLLTDAAADAERQTLPGMLLGTPAYMAPEQAEPNEPVDNRADVYALGVLAYELLVGKPPFAGESYAGVLAGHRMQAPPAVKTLVPSVPAKLDALIMRCLAKQPADRWQSVEEILRELDMGPVAVAPVPSAGGSFRRWRWPLLAAGVVGLAAPPVAVWWHMRPTWNIDPNRVAVERFDNTTCDSVFGALIADGVTDGLARTEGVRVVPAAAVRAIVAQRKGLPAPNDPLPVARATGAGIIVTGSCNRRGDLLEIQPEVIDVAREQPVASIARITVPYSNPDSAIASVIGRVAVAIAGVVNPRLADHVAVSRLPMSIPAYREYDEALDLYFRGETAAAVSHAYEAIRLDSTSTSALLWAAMIEWSASFDLPKVESLLQRVERSQTEPPPYDLAHLEFLRAYLNGDLEGVLRAARRRPDLAGGNAVVQANMRLNRIDTAYALITEVMKRSVAERHPISWQFLTEILHVRGEFRRELREARKGLAEMRSAGSESAAAELLGYEIRSLAARGDVKELRRALDTLHTLRPASDVFASATRELRWHGHPLAAAEIGLVAEQWYREALTRSPDRHVRLMLAETLFELERWDDARPVFDSLAAEKLPPQFTLERGTSSDIIPFAYNGIIDARLGDTVAAHTSIDSLGAVNGPYRYGEPQFWQAAIAAQLGDCIPAVQFLQESLSKGTSIWYGLRLESSMFRPIDRCPEFAQLKSQPYRRLEAGKRPQSVAR